MKLKNLVKIIKEEHKDKYVPTYGTGDVVHDCPKHVEEIKSGHRGDVVSHSLNESGQVNFIDVKYANGNVKKNQPTKNFRILEGQTHEHAVKAEPSINENPLIDKSVDWSTIKLASNIDQKWEDGRNMEDDLVDWFDASVGAGGTELGEDLIYSLQSVLKRWEKINDAYTR